MKQFLTTFLCGYLEDINTQHALIAVVEKWKSSLDKKEYDLSKAFDTINHELLVAKFMHMIFINNL